MLVSEEQTNKQTTNQIGYIRLTMGPAVVVVTSTAGGGVVVVVVVVAKDEVVAQSLTSANVHSLGKTYGNCSSQHCWTLVNFFSQGFVFTPPQGDPSEISQFLTHMPYNPASQST